MKINQPRTVRVLTLAKLARMTPSQLTRSTRQPEPDQPLRAFYFATSGGKTVVFAEHAPMIKARQKRSR